MTSENTQTALFVTRSGAWLTLLSLLTGGYATAAMTGLISANPRMALGAHVSGLVGALLIFALAWSLPLLRFSDTGRRRLAWLMIVPSFANWFITAVKAAFDAPGLTFTGNPANDIVFGALSVFVVLPSIAAGVAWVYGLYGPRPSQ